MIVSDSDSELIIHLPQNIGNPARSALAEAGITRLGQLTTVSEKDLLQLHGVGPKAIRLLREALAIRGLSFAQPDRASTARKRANQQPPRQASKKSSS